MRKHDDGMTMWRARSVSKTAYRLGLFLLLGLFLGSAPPPIPPIAVRVTFPSADRTTMMVGYLFRPQGTASRENARGRDDARPGRCLLRGRRWRIRRAHVVAPAS